MTELLSAEYIEFYATIALLIIAVIRLTAWGKANKEALDAVVENVEVCRAGAVKANLRRDETSISGGARDAIKDAVHRADPKKDTPSAAKEVSRVLLPYAIRQGIRLIKRKAKVGA